jgi:glucosylceramidase
MGGGGGTAPTMPALVTSGPGAFWSTSTSWTAVTTGTADVTVNDGTNMQTWEGFGGAFNEAGWLNLQKLSAGDQTTALNLLFGTNGAHFTMGRIPIGASDYAQLSGGGDPRYTEDETAGDTSMSKFSISRDMTALVPYVWAAMKINPSIRFWASPWTPPTWMKTFTGNVTSGGKSCAKAGMTNFDGGCMQAGTNNANITALVLYFNKWIAAYKGLSPPVTIDTLAPQNEPNYAQGYPSALWAPALYTQMVDALGKDMTFMASGTKIMLGTMSNGDNGMQSLDLTQVNNTTGDTTAKGLVKMVGLQWGMLDIYESLNTANSQSWLTIPGLNVWATEHKCGNYPWNPSGTNPATGVGYGSYVEPAPNDQNYGIETWDYIRNAIRAGVTSYNAWNMVLDPGGKGNDTARQWAQDSLVIVQTSGTCKGNSVAAQVCATPAYYAFRHVSQFVSPGAHALSTTGNNNDAVAFKNMDGSIITVMHNAGSNAKSMIVKLSGANKMLQVPSVPANGWATVNYVP